MNPKETSHSNRKKVEDGLTELRASEKVWKTNNYGIDVDYDIRFARKEDASELANLYRISFPEYPYTKVQEEEYHLGMADNLGFIRLVEVSQEEGLVGACGVPLTPECLLGEIVQVVKHPDCQTNYASLPMINVSCEICSDIGIEKLFAKARTRSPGMQKAFLRCGFDPYGIEIGQYVVYHDRAVRETMVLMYKFLGEGKKRIDEMGSIEASVKKRLKHNLARQVELLELDPYLALNLLTEDE